MNILIIRFSALGDLVTLEPTFRAIRHFFPDANITFITSGIGKGLYADTLYFNNFIIHTNTFQTLKQIQEKKFDIVYNLHCNSLSHFLNIFINKKKTTNIAANLFQKILGIKIKAKELEQLLRESGINHEKIMNYFQDNVAKRISLEYKKNSDLHLPKKYIAISTGSSQRWLSKKWGIENYKELIIKLHQLDYDIVLIGTELELSESKQIKIASPFVYDLTNKSNLSQLKCILGHASLYIGNDSGPTHIAAAVKTNTLTIFGPTGKHHSPKFGRYFGEHAYVTPSEKIDCHPCYKPICPKNMECMKDITIGDVYSSAKRLINA